VKRLKLRLVNEQSNLAPGREAFVPTGVSVVLEEPVFAAEGLDHCEFALVGGNESCTEGESVGGDEEIVGAKDFAILFEARAERAIFLVGRRLEWQNFDGGKNLFHAGGESRRYLASGTETKLGGEDDAGGDFGVGELADPICGAAVRVANQIGEAVGVPPIER
jgi:hypothetical protein